MATDVRKHIVPTAGDPPRRQAILDLGLSIRDVIPVANTTARAQLITAMTAAGVAPSTTNPVTVFRADAGAGVEIEYTSDGSTWRTIRADDSGWIAISPNTGFLALDSAAYRRIRNVLYLRGRIAMSTGSFPPGTSTVFTLPVGFRPPVVARLPIAFNVGKVGTCTIVSGAVSIEVDVATGSSAYLGSITLPVD